MKIKKEDLNYVAGVATGMEKGSNSPVKPKKKYKFKGDSSSVSGMTRSFYEENKVEKNSRVADILNILLEEVEKEKKTKNEILKEEKPDAKLLEDYKTIKFIAQKGINEVSNGYNNKKLMNDILDLVMLYKGDESLGEGAAETSFTNRSIDSAQPAEEETQDGLQDTGRNNPTE